MLSAGSAKRNQRAMKSFADYHRSFYYRHLGVVGFVGIMGSLLISQLPVIASTMPCIIITTTFTQTELCVATHNSVATTCVAFVLEGIADQVDRKVMLDSQS